VDIAASQEPGAKIEAVDFQTDPQGTNTGGSRLMVRWQR